MSGSATDRGDRRIVIVGASMAGLRAAEQVRAAGWTGAVTVVGEEPHAPYNRPPLSKDALSGDAPPTIEDWHAPLAFRMKRSVADVEWRLGTRVVAADLMAGTVTTDSAQTLDFDGLVIATGLRPRRLQLPGPTRGRHVLRSLDDARSLRLDLVPGARVVIIGAGFIGSEVAMTALSLGCVVTLVEPMPTPMERALGAAVGDAIAEHHRQAGISVLTGRSVVGFAGDGSVDGVQIGDGSVVPADVVVESVGSHPNVEWLHHNGLDLTDGVLADNSLAVPGFPNVVAVGDVARFPNPRTGDEPRRVEHWCVPTDTAKRAARTLVDHLHGDTPPREPFSPLASFWSDQGDLRLQSFGSPALGTSSRVASGVLQAERLAEGVAVEYFIDDQLVGVLLINVPPAQHRAHRDAVDASTALAHTTEGVLA